MFTSGGAGSNVSPPLCWLSGASAQSVRRTQASLRGQDHARHANCGDAWAKPPALGASFSEQRRVEPRSPGFETARRRNYEGKKAVFDRASQTWIGYTTETAYSCGGAGLLPLSGLRAAYPEIDLYATNLMRSDVRTKHPACACRECSRDYCECGAW